MSELIPGNDSCTRTHWKLLAGVSVLALLTYVSSSEAGMVDDASKPDVWLEFGGQLERMDGKQQPFAPSFTHSLISDGTIPGSVSQKLPPYSSGFEGSILFEPRGSDWHFSATIRYGRSNNSNSSHHQTDDPPLRPILISIPFLGFYLTNHSPNIDAEPISRKLGDTDAKNREGHAVLDFQVGRDVGVGLFGGNSDIELGVRFAQFTKGSNVRITANGGADWLPYKYKSTFNGFPAHIYAKTESWDVFHANANISRSFRGVGPSLAFNTSVPFAGNPQNGQIAFELGVNGALLFGRQKASIHHETLHQRPYVPHHYNFIPLQTVYHHSYNTNRARSVTVPNIGGFGAISFNYVNAKISVGYRTDFFFGAMDTGIDTRDTRYLGFNGPFATVSIGMGG